MPLAGGSGQVPLSTEPIQGNVRVFYHRVSLKSHPQGWQAAEGAWFGEATEPPGPCALESCSQIKAVPVRGKVHISALQMLQMLLT